MRRALLIFALAAPALALAGTVSVVAPDDRFVNISECSSATATVRLQWTVTFQTGSLASGVYRVFATNTNPTTSGSTASFCETTDDPTNNIFADQIGADIPVNIALSTQSENRLTRLFAPAAGFDCSEGQSQKTIYVCVHFHPDSNPGTATGWATGTLLLDLRRPAAPSGLSSSPGDGALNVAWTASNAGDVEADSYRVELTPSQGGSTTTVETRSTSVRVGGLANDVQYDIRVWAVSVAKNDSQDPVAIVGYDPANPDPSRTPTPVADFWDFYSGAEQGGCSAGAAGPVALLGIAGLLSLIRRRK